MIELSVEAGAGGETGAVATATIICWTILGLTIVIAFAITVFSLTKKAVIIDVNTTYSSAEIALNYYNIWRRNSLVWLAVDYLLMIVPFELSSFILYLEVMEKGGDPKVSVFVFSVLSMLLIILNHVLSPRLQAKLYRKAFMELHPILFSGKITDLYSEEMFCAIKRGEAMINKVYD